MSGATTAVAATKGFRGVAQDFLAPELRALTERIQGFENLNRERFTNVDHRFTELGNNIDQRFSAVDHRFAELGKNIDQRFSDVDHRFSELSKSVDQRFDDVVKRLDRIDERLDRMDARLDRMDERFNKIDERLNALPAEFAKSIDRLVASLDVSNRLAAIERRALTE